MQRLIALHIEWIKQPQKILFPVLSFFFYMYLILSTSIAQYTTYRPKLPVSIQVTKISKVHRKVLIKSTFLLSYFGQFWGISGGGGGWQFWEEFSFFKQSFGAFRNANFGDFRDFNTPRLKSQHFFKWQRILSHFDPLHISLQTLQLTIIRSLNGYYPVMVSVVVQWTFGQHKISGFRGRPPWMMKCLPQITTFLFGGCCHMTGGGPTWLPLQTSWNSSL